MIDNVRIEKKFYDDGALLSNEYYFGDQLHREGCPAIESFYPDGTLWYRAWYVHGRYHRDDGPTTELFRGDGTLWYWEWHRHGKYHREDGPAEEWFSVDGKQNLANYWFDGKQVSKAEHSRIVALRKLAASASGGLEVSL